MIHFVCGSTGAGKSTFARRLAEQVDGVYFAVDDWMRRLFMPDLQGEISFQWAMQRIERCEEQIWQTVARLQQLGIDAVLELSLSTRQLRDKHRAFAEQSGFDWQMYFLDVDADTRWQRVQQRNLEKGETFYLEVSREMFDFVENMFEPPVSEEMPNILVISD